MIIWQSSSSHGRREHLKYFSAYHKLWSNIRTLQPWYPAKSVSSSVLHFGFGKRNLGFRTRAPGKIHLKLVDAHSEIFSNLFHLLLLPLEHETQFSTNSEFSRAKCSNFPKFLTGAFAYSLARRTIGFFGSGQPFRASRSRWLTPLIGQSRTNN